MTTIGKTKDDVKSNNVNYVDKMIFFLPLQICPKAVNHGKNNDQKNDLNPASKKNKKTVDI
jgi:hypothetical protein